MSTSTMQHAMNTVFAEDDPSIGISTDSEQNPGKVYQEAVQLLAQEMNGLSVEELNQVYEDIHGVSQVIPESPQKIKDAIHAVKDVLRSLPKAKKRDLDKAFFLKPSMENDEAFFLIFLRAKRFKIEETAACICAHFSTKVELFGTETIVDKITLDHLPKESIDLIRRGAIQVLFDRESTGRAIQLCNMSLWQECDWRVFAKFLWYINYASIDGNDDLQRRGFVTVINCHGNVVGRAILYLLWKTTLVHHHLPVHINSMHICKDSHLLDVFRKALFATLPKTTRMRQKHHYGSVEETIKQLMTFGLNLDGCFEVRSISEHKECNQEYLARCKQAEADFEAAWRKQDQEQRTKDGENRGAMLRYPRHSDILMGRSYFVRDWPGNVAFSEVIKATAPRYSALDKNDSFQKTVMTIDIIQFFQDKGIQFLDRTEDGWRKATAMSIRVKVSQSIRNEIKAKHSDR